jgi:hypothetical protein
LAGNIYAASFKYVQPILQAYLLIQNCLTQAVTTASASTAARWGAAAEHHAEVKQITPDLFYDSVVNRADGVLRLFQQLGAATRRCAAELCDDLAQTGNVEAAGA